MIEKIINKIEKQIDKKTIYSSLAQNLTKLSIEEKQEVANYYLQIAKKEIMRSDVFAMEKQVGKYFRKNDDLQENENLILLNELERNSLIVCSLYSMLPFNNPLLMEREYNIIINLFKQNNIKPCGLSLERLYETQKAKLSDTLINDIKNLYVKLIKHHENVKTSATATLKLLYTVSSMIEAKPGVRKFAVLDAFENRLKDVKIGYESIYK